MRLLLLWSVGFAARVTLLAVPPLIPSMHRDLVLDETAIGALGGLPILVLAGGTLLGSLVIARLGARRAGVIGFVTVGVAGALRGLGPSVPMLFAATIAMAVGVALAQLSIPSLVAAWEPGRIARATATYANGMLFGEVAGAGLTATVLLPLASGSWEGALALWTLPVAAVALALALQPDTARPEIPVEWWPRWRDARVWTIAFGFGAASLAYWGANTHLPDFLHATGHADDVPAALTSLNGFQLPASLVVAAAPALFVARRWPFVAAGAVTLLCALGLVATAGAASAAWTGVLGFVSALVFVLALALPPLLVPSHEVHRFSAAVFSVAYAFAFAGSLAAGALWDATGIPAMAIAPIGAAGALMAIVGSRLVLRAERAA